MLTSLIVIPSPRDIEQVWKSTNSIQNVPKLWIKYYNESDAYRIIERYFLEQTEADYLVIAPDDLLVRDQDYQAIVKTIYDHGGPEQIQIISGVCNLHDIPGYGTTLAICVDDLIHPIRRRRHYAWADTRGGDWIAKGHDKTDLLKVKFTGFALQFIRRDFVQQYGLHGDLEFNDFDRNSQDLSFDVILSYTCNQNNIPIYVNPQVWMHHLKGSHLNDVPGIEPLQVGSKEPKTLFIDQEGKETDVTELCNQYPPQKPTIRDRSK